MVPSSDHSISNCHSPKGWTDAEISMEWMVKHFDVQTQDKAEGQTWVLLLDGHSSHYTPELLEYARDQNIMILGYPPHCTHALQGLDVVCFAWMKKAWKQVINEFATLHRAQVTKGDFTSLFGRAYRRAFTKEMIKAAFKAIGVYPFDCTVITTKQIKPSEATSVKGQFAITWTSPVCAIMTSFKTYKPTFFDVSPAHVRPPPPITTHTVPLATTPPNPSLKGICDANIDPALMTPETPSKHMCMMTHHWLRLAQAHSLLTINFFCRYIESKIER